MSSSNLNNFRKRKFDISTSDSLSSDEDISLPKIRKRNGDTNIPRSIASRLRCLFDWISDLSVKDYFISAIKMGAMIPETPVMIVDEEDEEDEVIILDDDDDDDDMECQILDERKKSSINQNNVTKRNVPNRRCSENARNYNPFGVSLCSLSSSSLSNFSHNACIRKTPTLRPRNSVHQKHINSSFYQLDSLSCSNLHPKSQESLPSSKRMAQISSPETDIEILFDANEKADTEASDVVIVSEIPTEKRRSYTVSPRQTPRNSRLCRNKIQAPEVKGTEEVQISVQKPARKSFTAHEVVRLQEKAQYQLLLDRYTKGPLYHSRAKPHSTTGVSDFGDESLKNDIAPESVDKFLQQYHRAVHSAKEETSSPTKQLSGKADNKAEGDDYDEIKILEVKLPEYKPVMKTKSDFFSSEWIAELKQTVSSETEERLKLVAERERQLEQYRKERAAKYAAEMQERDRLKLTTGVHPNIAIEEEVDFLEMTPEMEAVLEKALANATPNTKLCTVLGSSIFRKDIDTLSGLNWLNDQVINCYVAMIAERSKSGKYPPVYCFNSFFYSQLKRKGYSSVKRWTRKVDIFSYALNIVPLHLDVHWCLAVIDHRAKTISYYDSMTEIEPTCVDTLSDYLIEEMKDKKGKVLEKGVYSTRIVKDIPMQMNGSDCGMFTLKYAEYLARDAKLTFSQKHMQYFRRRMVYELLTNQLLSGLSQGSVHL
ncbi:Sentrin-specific protease 1, partial [Stegodyphus mimosarum]